MNAGINSFDGDVGDQSRSKSLTWLVLNPLLDKGFQFALDQ